MSMAEGGTRIAKLELGTITFKVFGSTQKNNHEQRKDRTVIEHVGAPSSQSEGVVCGRPGHRIKSSQSQHVSGNPRTPFYCHEITTSLPFQLAAHNETFLL
jgi:hypothetical protein